VSELTREQVEARLDDPSWTHEHTDAHNLATALLAAWDERAAKDASAYDGERTSAAPPTYRDYRLLDGKVAVRLENAKMTELVVRFEDDSGAEASVFWKEADHE